MLARLFLRFPECSSEYCMQGEPAQSEIQTVPLGWVGLVYEFMSGYTVIFVGKTGVELFSFLLGQLCG